MFEKYVEKEFEQYYSTLTNSKLCDYIRYSSQGGKCLRGFIVKHIITTLSKKVHNFWQPVVCVELLHSASLMIDDLPCMDNDKIRRNKPSMFVEFGERRAILVSFYLVSEAFKLLQLSFRQIRPILKEEDINDIKFNLEDHLETLYSMCDYWNDLIGNKLIVGQLIDLREDVEELMNIKIPKTKREQTVMIYKTSSLFSFSFILGAIYSLNVELNLEEFKEMGHYMGIMYQLMDDYNDKDKSGETNHVASCGYTKSINLYKESRVKLISLLEKNGIKTEELMCIIHLMDTKIDYDDEEEVKPP